MAKELHFVRHLYTVDKIVQSYTVYTLCRTITGGAPILTQKVRIEKFRGYSDAIGITDYLRLRNTSSWARCEKVTGLRPTKRNGVYYGDRKAIVDRYAHAREGKETKSLILFHFNADRSRLIIDVFPAFHPTHRGILQKIIDNHVYHVFNEKEGGVQTSL